MKNIITSIILASAFVVGTVQAASKPVASPVAASKVAVVAKTPKASAVASKPTKKAVKSGSNKVTKNASAVAASKK